MAALDETVRRHFLSLVIFREDEVFGVKDLRVWWLHDFGDDDFAIEEILDELVSKSLLLVREGGVVLHDLLFSYLRIVHSRESLAEQSAKYFESSEDLCLCQGFLFDLKATLQLICLDRVLEFDESRLPFSNWRGLVGAEVIKAAAGEGLLHFIRFIGSHAQEQLSSADEVCY